MKDFDKNKERYEAQAVLMRKSNVYVGGTQIAKMIDPKPTSSSSSGARGVVWLKNAKKWRAMLTFRGEHHYLGIFNTFDEAVEARKNAEESYFVKFIEEMKKSGDFDSLPDKYKDVIKEKVLKEETK